jgi:hypothetical protein
MTRATPKPVHRRWPGVSHLLGCSAIFANQAAEDLLALDPGGDIDGVAGLAQRRFLPQGLVRTAAVVVPGVFGQDAAEMPFAEDQYVI